MPTSSKLLPVSSYMTDGAGCPDSAGGDVYVETLKEASLKVASLGGNIRVPSVKVGSLAFPCSCAANATELCRLGCALVT